ncbi:MAG: tRNA (adenosine(37)-N6)-threonylcarbamoyltransferase complex ATPase subunit type 1 TsaE [Phycisphaerales bacterium JB061]
MKAVVSSLFVEDTERLGASLAAVLRPGDVVLLRGELGSGKTTLVRSVVAGLGMDASQVSSPTYVIANEYEGEGAPTVVHVDAYRLSGSDELDSIGWERIVGGDGGGAIVFIEWPERIEEALPEGCAQIRITQRGETSRRIEIDTPSSWNERPGMLALVTPRDTRGDTTCPVTGERVPGGSPTWPFASERARLTDLYQWMNEGYTITREIHEADLDQGD